MLDAVDPFIGTDAADPSRATGLAASWWWPKPPVGNTHPGATHPFGMVSACAYSGGYPTGYGSYERSTEGEPRRQQTGQSASGFTHFQQSGTGAIRNEVQSRKFVRTGAHVGIAHGDAQGVGPSRQQ